jgi:hypothetical protein
VNGEPGANSSNREFREDVANDDYLYETLQNFTTVLFKQVFSLNEVTEFCSLVSQPVGLVPGDEYQL